MCSHFFFEVDPQLPMDSFLGERDNEYGPLFCRQCQCMKYVLVLYGHTFEATTSCTKEKREKKEILTKIEHKMTDFAAP